jgi:hypothetical protein
MIAFGIQLARAALVATLLAAMPVSASSILVTVDTSALAGTQADLAFDLVDGGPPSNAVTITTFATDGTLGAASTKGNVTGALPGSVTLADTAFLSEYRQAATLGKSLSFVINATGKPPNAASFPDGFSFFLLDHATGLPLVTTSHPTGANALLLLSIGTSALPDLYASDNVRISAVPRADSRVADFCDGTSYDNAVTQTTGLFTDLRNGAHINADYGNCALAISGRAGGVGDMWITLVAPPEEASPPTYGCVSIDASVTIPKFDNRKAVGFVANYDATTKKGLLLAVHNDANRDALTLSTFDGATGSLLATVKTLFLGKKILRNVAYALALDICYDGTTLKATGTVRNDKVNEALSYSGPMPAGISPSGQIGIAGQAQRAFVDSIVSKFEWGPIE